MLRLSIGLLVVVTAGCPEPRSPSPTRSKTEITIVGGHDGAEKLVVGPQQIASTFDGRTTISRRAGGTSTRIPGVLAGIDGRGRVVVVQRKPGRIVLAAMSPGDTGPTALGSYSLKDPDSETVPADASSPFIAERKQWRITGAVLTGAPATVVFSVSLVGAHETRLLAADLTDGNVLFEQRRLGSQGNGKLRGIAAHPTAAEVAISVERSAEGAEPSALYLLNARTGQGLWKRALARERWGDGDGQLALSQRGDVLFAAAGQLRRFRHADGAKQASHRISSSGLRSLAASADGKRAVVLWSTTPAHGFGRGGHWVCSLMLAAFGTQEPEFLAQESDRCPTGVAAFAADGRIWTTRP